MSHLCNLVQIALESQDLESAIPNAKLETDGTDCCRLSNKEIQIELISDHRDHQITSAITFLNEPSEYQEKMQTHVLWRLFEKDISSGNQKNVPLDELVKCEVASNIDLLIEIRRAGYSAREITLFYRGYNAGYTDSVGF